jgi:hypothetical protein
MTAISMIEQRLEMLEGELARSRRSGARYRLLCAALSCLLLGLAGFAATTRAPVTEVVQTRRLEIVDGKGRLVLAAAASPNGGQLDVWNSDGHNLLRLSGNEHGGDLAMWNSAGVNVFGAFATSNGGEAALWNAQGNRAIRAFAQTDGGRLDIHDNKDRPMFSGAGTALGGTLVMRNSDGASVMSALVDDRGAGQLKITDAAGKAGLAKAEQERCTF